MLSSNLMKSLCPLKGTMVKTGLAILPTIIAPVDQHRGLSLTSFIQNSRNRVPLRSLGANDITQSMWWRRIISQPSVFVFLWKLLHKVHMLIQSWESKASSQCADRCVTPGCLHYSWQRRDFTLTTLDMSCAIGK